MVNEAPKQLELLDMVTTKSSPADAALELDCAWDCSEEETLLAVPPKAVVLILNVAVQVPDEDIEVVSVMVMA